jgi:elongation factor G
MEPALISLDITPKTPADREKLARALQALAAEDGTLEVRADVERDCTVIGATSEAHLEGIVDRLSRTVAREAIRALIEAILLEPNGDELKSR